MWVVGHARMCCRILSGNFFEADRCLQLRRKAEVEGVKSVGSDHVYCPAAPIDRAPCAPLRFHGYVIVCIRDRKCKFNMSAENKCNNYMFEKKLHFWWVQIYCHG